jgi:outer membrane protein W
MKANRFIVTILSAAALLAAGACRTSSTTKTTTNSSTMTTTTPASTSYGTTAVATTDNNGTVVTDQNGTNVTKTTTTTTIYKNGQAVTTDANGNTIASTNLDTSGQASSSSTTTAPVLPAGAAVVVTTTTTTKSTPAVASASASVSGNQAPMTSSTTTYVPYENRTFFGHRFPTMDILAFADRATFSNNDRAINGSLNTGPLSTSLRGENGWGVGFNWYFGSRFSTEFTGSRIRPRATFTPTNAGFNPITGLRIRMTPITGAFQIHFMPHASINPYIGGGAEYVTFHADRGFNAGTSGLTSLNIRDEWGPMVQAGLRLGNAHGLSFNVDGKYSWIRARTQTTFDNVTIGNVGNGSRFGVNPLILSAGIRLGF